MVRGTWRRHFWAHPSSSAIWIYDIHELTLRQSVTPPEVLGRVNGSMQMLFKGFWPPGAIVGGLIAQRYGVRFTLTLAALGIFASLLWLMFSPVRGLKGHAHKL